MPDNEKDPKKPIDNSSKPIGKYDDKDVYQDSSKMMNYYVDPITKNKTYITESPILTGDSSKWSQDEYLRNDAKLKYLDKKRKDVANNKYFGEGSYTDDIFEIGALSVVNSLATASKFFDFPALSSEFKLTGEHDLTEEDVAKMSDKDKKDYYEKLNFSNAWLNETDRIAKSLEDWAVENVELEEDDNVTSYLNDVFKNMKSSAPSFLPGLAAGLLNGVPYIGTHLSKAAQMGVTILSTAPSEAKAFMEEAINRMATERSQKNGTTLDAEIEAIKNDPFTIQAIHNKAVQVGLQNAMYEASGDIFFSATNLLGDLLKGKGLIKNLKNVKSKPSEFFKELIDFKTMVKRSGKDFGLDMFTEAITEPIQGQTSENAINQLMIYNSFNSTTNSQYNEWLNNASIVPTNVYERFLKKEEGDKYAIGIHELASGGILSGVMGAPSIIGNLYANRNHDEQYKHHLFEIKQLANGDSELFKLLKKNLDNSHITKNLIKISNDLEELKKIQNPDTKTLESIKNLEKILKNAQDDLFVDYSIEMMSNGLGFQVKDTLEKIAFGKNKDSKSLYNSEVIEEAKNRLQLFNELEFIYNNETENAKQNIVNSLNSGLLSFRNGYVREDDDNYNALKQLDEILTKNNLKIEDIANRLSRNYSNFSTQAKYRSKKLLDALEERDGLKSKFNESVSDFSKHISNNDVLAEIKNSQEPLAKKLLDNHLDQPYVMNLDLAIVNDVLHQFINSNGLNKNGEVVEFQKFKSEKFESIKNKVLGENRFYQDLKIKLEKAKELKSELQSKELNVRILKGENNPKDEALTDLKITDTEKVMSNHADIIYLENQIKYMEDELTNYLNNRFDKLSREHGELFTNFQIAAGVQNILHDTSKKIFKNNSDINLDAAINTILDSVDYASSNKYADIITNKLYPNKRKRIEIEEQADELKRKSQNSQQNESQISQTQQSESNIKNEEVEVNPLNIEDDDPKNGRDIFNLENETSGAPNQNNTNQNNTNQNNTNQNNTNQNNTNQNNQTPEKPKKTTLSQDDINIFNKKINYLIDLYNSISKDPNLDPDILDLFDLPFLEQFKSEVDPFKIITNNFNAISLVDEILEDVNLMLIASSNNNASTKDEIKNSLNVLQSLKNLHNNSTIGKNVNNSTPAPTSIQSSGFGNNIVNGKVVQGSHYSAYTSTDKGEDFYYADGNRFTVIDTISNPGGTRFFRELKDANGNIVRTLSNYTNLGKIKNGQINTMAQYVSRFTIDKVSKGDSIELENILKLAVEDYIANKLKNDRLELIKKFGIKYSANESILAILGTIDVLGEYHEVSNVKLDPFTYVNANKIGKNKYEIHHIGDASYSVIDKNGNIVKTVGLSTNAQLDDSPSIEFKVLNNNNQTIHEFFKTQPNHLTVNEVVDNFINSGLKAEVISSKVELKSEIIELKEGETLILSTDVIETEEHLKLSLENHKNKKDNVHINPKNNEKFKDDDGATIFIEFETDQTQSNNNQTQSNQATQNNNQSQNNNEDELFYFVQTQNGVKKYKRVSNFIKGSIEYGSKDQVTNVKNALPIGNFFDTFARLFFKNPNFTLDDLNKELKDKNVEGLDNIKLDKIFFEELKLRFLDVRTEILKLHGVNSIFETDSMLLTDESIKFKDDDSISGIGGVVDMIVIDDKGNMHIYDFKTLYADLSNNLTKSQEKNEIDSKIRKSFKGSSSKKGSASKFNKWVSQQTLYKTMLDKINETNKNKVEVDTRIIATPIFYGREEFKGNISNKSEPNNFTPKPILNYQNYRKNSFKYSQIYEISKSDQADVKLFHDALIREANGSENTSVLPKATAYQEVYYSMFSDPDFDDVISDEQEKILTQLQSLDILKKNCT